MRSRPQSEKPIDWLRVRRVLVVKLRSIGDTVLATPSVHALRRFLPDAQIDILLEDWVAPLLDGHEDINRVIRVGRGTIDRLKVAAAVARTGYDVAFNLHGGTTATFFTAASRSKHRVGFANYQYSFLYNHLLLSSSDFWEREKTHSAEQQLALLGYVGVPVDDRPKSRLIPTPAAADSVETNLEALGVGEREIALLHPSTAFATKQWPVANFARTAEFLTGKGLHPVAIASKAEAKVLEDLVAESKTPITIFDGLTLPEITALAARSRIFIGNDSGMAHIAAAVGTPTLVIFGSSNRAHWSPWTDGPNEVVYQHFDCQPCSGYKCEVFGEPRCIIAITPDAVSEAASRLLSDRPAAAGGLRCKPC